MPVPNAFFNHKGFTLIELLLVVALLGISVGITSDILLSLIRSYNKTQVIHEIEQQANFVSLKLEKEMRNSINARYDADSGLSLTLRDNTPVLYFLSEDVLYRSITGSVDDADPVTNASGLGGVKVTCFGECFVVAGPSPLRVSYAFDFSQAGSSLDRSFIGFTSIGTTVVLRNTY